MATEIAKSDIVNYIGYESSPTEWMVIDQDMINRFADATFDHQFIHVDPALAEKTPFGSTIAHGFLSLSLLSHFSAEFGVVIEGAYMGVNYGFDKVRFLCPVNVGSRIRAVAKVSDIGETSPGSFRVVTNVTIEIEGSTKPAMIADWISVQLVA